MIDAARSHLPAATNRSTHTHTIHRAQGSIQCIVEIEAERKVLRARLDDDRVVCENATVSLSVLSGISRGARDAH